MPFVKLDCKILDKSIWDEDSDTRIAWITLLTMADSDGLVEASITGIASRARISLQNAEKAIKKFMEPDLLSTNNTNDGRRIDRNNNGFQILNYQVYRDKDYTSAARQRKHRELSRVTGVTSPHTYMYMSESVLSYLNLKTGKRYRNNKEILARLKDGYTEDQLKGIIDAKICDPYFIENGQYLNPITLFRKSHIDNYINQKPDEFKVKKSGKGIPAMIIVDPTWEKEHHYDSWMTVQNGDKDKIIELIKLYEANDHKLSPTDRETLKAWKLDLEENK